MSTLWILWTAVGEGVAPPTIEDPDSDISVTNRTAASGETVRAPRLVTAHSADGIREADLTGHDRAHRIDRHQIRSSRTARNPSKGSRFEYQMECIRAGETWALDRLVAWLSPEGSRERAVDTTSRTGADGETLAVPTFAQRVVADSEREAELDMIVAASVQDRWLARFAIPSDEGCGQRWMVEIETDGRAGACFALDRIVAEVSPTEARPRAADTTSRTGAAGETLAVPTFAMRASADAEREADLDMITGASVQDRWLARFAIPSAQGLAQRWTWEIETDGRAGATFALDRIVGWVNDAADARPGDET